MADLSLLLLHFLDGGGGPEWQQMEPSSSTRRVGAEASRERSQDRKKIARTAVPGDYRGCSWPNSVLGEPRLRYGRAPGLSRYLYAVRAGAKARALLVT